MLRKYFSYLTMLVALFLFCACSGANDHALPTQAGQSEELSAATPLHTDSDYDNNYGMPYTSVVDTGEALIWNASRINSDPYLRYFDKAAPSQDSDELPYGFLCSKPECMHNSDQCAAYLGICPPSLGFMDGKLYWVASGASAHPEVYCFDADFSQKQRVCTLDFGFELQPARYFFHRGGLYFISLANTVEADGVPSARLDFVSCDISTGMHTSLLVFDIPQIACEYCVQFVGMKAYIANGPLTQKADFRIYCVDLETGEVDNVLPSCDIIHTSPWMHVTDDGTVYVGDWQSTLYEVRDSTLVPVMKFEGDYLRVHPFDKAIAATYRVDREMRAYIKSYDGETLFDGILPTDMLEGLNMENMGLWVCGDGEMLLIHYHFTLGSGNYEDLLVRYELIDGEMTAALIGAAP